MKTKSIFTGLAIGTIFIVIVIVALSSPSDAQQVCDLAAVDPAFQDKCAEALR